MNEWSTQELLLALNDETVLSFNMEYRSDLDEIDLITTHTKGLGKCSTIAIEDQDAADSICNVLIGILLDPKLRTKYSNRYIQHARLRSIHLINTSPYGEY